MLGFLKNVQVIVPATAPKKGGGARKERNPVNADIRVFADGSVYPSLELVQRFNLEYGNKPAEKEDPTGNGFDIIDSDEFRQWIVVGRRCIWISPVPRSESKVDLFGSVGYDKDTGEAVSSVIDQGPVTFGKATLLPLLEQVYGLKLQENEDKLMVFPDGKRYVDLKFYGSDEKNTPFFLPPGKTVAFIPKAKQRGEEKGTPTVIKRENPEFYCLYPVDAPEEQTEEPAAKTKQAVAEPA